MRERIFGKWPHWSFSQRFVSCGASAALSGQSTVKRHTRECAPKRLHAADQSEHVHMSAVHAAGTVLRSLSFCPDIGVGVTCTDGVGGGAVGAAMVLVGAGGGGGMHARSSSGLME